MKVRPICFDWTVTLSTPQKKKTAIKTNLKAIKTKLKAIKTKLKAIKTKLKAIKTKLKAIKTKLKDKAEPKMIFP